MPPQAGEIVHFFRLTGFGNEKRRSKAVYTTRIGYVFDLVDAGEKRLWLKRENQLFLIRWHAKFFYITAQLFTAQPFGFCRPAWARSDTRFGDMPQGFQTP
mgnify:CR=1 FL=1